MGFLKFLKKEKKEMPIDEGLDIPPPPPALKGDLPKFELKDLPEPPVMEKKEELPGFKFTQEKPMPIKDELLELPKIEPLETKEPSEPLFPPLEETPKFVPKPPLKESVREIPLLKTGSFEPKIEQPKIIPKHEKPFYEKIEERAVREEKALLSKRWTDKGPLFIRLSRYKDMLRDISVIRGDLKKSDFNLINLVKSKEEKDKEFEKWHDIIGDVQKKLIFIEKTLFKD